MIGAQNTYSTLPCESVVALQGASRQIYGFTAFPLDAPPGGPGIFVFARPADVAQRDTLYWAPLYVGESCGLAEAVSGLRDIVSHARKLGATHLLVHFCGRGEDARQEKAKDLAEALQPSLNRLGHAADAA